MGQWEEKWGTLFLYYMYIKLKIYLQISLLPPPTGCFVCWLHICPQLSMSRIAFGILLPSQSYLPFLPIFHKWGTASPFNQTPKLETWAKFWLLCYSFQVPHCNNIICYHLWSTSYMAGSVIDVPMLSHLILRRIHALCETSHCSTFETRKLKLGEGK